MFHQRAIDGLDVHVDHGCPGLGHRQSRLGTVDAELVGGRIHRRARPAVEHRMLADRQSEALAEFFERSRLIRVRLIHGG